MPNGHYDEDAGVCYPDEVAPDAGSKDPPDAGSDFPHMERPESVPPECWSDTLGTDWDCMNRDTLSNILDAILNALKGKGKSD